MSTSNTYDFNMSGGDIVLEAFDRCGIRPAMLTSEHFISARRSLNLELATWSNRGPNLWAIDLQTIPLIQGISTYTLPADTVIILDAYRETYQLSNTTNQAPNFSTIISSATVTVVQANNGMLVGNWINVAVPVAIGGIVISGFYQVVSVVNTNTYTITAASNATSTVNNSGVVPLLSATSGNAAITVTLTNHGFVVGQTFNLIQTTVGGLILSGGFTVATVVDANNFTFDAPQDAVSTNTAYENTGLVQIQNQSSTVDPIDTIMMSVSRDEYAQYPDKVLQGVPTVFWYNRVLPPQVTVWQPPDNNGPYTFKYYRMRRLQDANVSMGQDTDMPFRFLEAICSGMAARLAQKYAPAMYESLKLEAKVQWQEAAIEDRERVLRYITPDLSVYWSDI